MRLYSMIIVIVLVLQSLTASTQSNVDSLSAWPGPDGSICMTPERAAKLINAEDSLVQLYQLNAMLDELLTNTELVVKTSTESIANLIEQKIKLEDKIEVMEKQLGIRESRANLFEMETDICTNNLNKANKQIKKQRTGMIVTSTIAGISIVGIIVSILVIVL